MPSRPIRVYTSTAFALTQSKHHFADWYGFADYVKQENLAGRSVTVHMWEYYDYPKPESPSLRLSRLRAILEASSGVIGIDLKELEEIQEQVEGLETLILERNERDG